MQTCEFPFLSVYVSTCAALCLCRWDALSASAFVCVCARICFQASSRVVCSFSFPWILHGFMDWIDGAIGSAQAQEFIRIKAWAFNEISRRVACLCILVTEATGDTSKDSKCVHSVFIAHALP